MAEGEERLDSEPKSRLINAVEFHESGQKENAAQFICLRYESGGVILLG